MSQPEFYDAIEIDCPKVADLLAALNPDFEGVPYEELHQKFLVLDFPEKGELTTIDPADFNLHFDHLRPGIKVKTTHFYKK